MAPSSYTGASGPVSGDEEPAELLAAAAAFLNGCGEVLLAEPGPHGLSALSDATDQLADLCPAGALRDSLLALHTTLEDLHDPEDIIADYRRLFGGPHRLLAPPWESVYLSGTKLVMQEPTRQVRAAYLQAGLAHAGLGQVPDDHIGLEFQFVGALLQRALTASACGDQPAAATDLQATRKFLEDHPCRWLTQLIERVTAGSVTVFYPALLKASAAVVDHVREAPAG